MNKALCTTSTPLHKWWARAAFLLALLLPAWAAQAQSTTTTLASTANPSSHSQAITLTASVTGTNPTGTVTFKDGTTVLGTATLAGAGSTRTAAFASSALAVGNHNLTAIYGGDVGNTTSTSSTLTQTVSKMTSSAALASSASPSNAGQGITLTATITGSNPGGTATFMDGAASIGVKAVSAGFANLAISSLAGGTHSLTVVYSGDTNNTTSTSSALTQTITALTTTTTLSVTPNPASVGQNVTLLARVNNSYVPSGTVTFSAGGSTLGTASLSGGAASLSINSLAQGSHSLSAAYSGDLSNTSNTSNSVSLTVNARSGMTWQYGYDAMGRPNTVVDPNAQASYIYYDGLGRPIQTQQPANAGSGTPTIVQMAWDAQDSLTRVVDPRVLTTTYTVNGLGDASSQSSPDTGNTTYSYDAKGNVTASVDARGKTTTFAWDNLDRLTTISYPTGTTTTFTYDGAPSPTAAEKGELTKITDESGQTLYAHDSMGRLGTKTVTIGAKTFTTIYAWSDSGSSLDKLTAITYPSGSRVNYGYDAAGSVNAISVTHVNANGSGLSATTTTLAGSVTYNTEGNVTGWLWSDGKSRTIGYDSTGLASSYTLGDPLGAGTAAGTLRSVSRDSAGRITGYTHTNNGSPVGALDHGFGYDNLDRLTSATLNSAATSYTYDDTGNRTSKTIGGTTYSNTVSSASNKLTQTQDVGGTASVTHDAAGHITSDGVNTYTYNDAGRMISASTGAGTVTFTYNGLNQRASKTLSGNTSYSLYDEAGQLLGEYDSNGVPVYETIYLGMMPVGVLKQTGTAGGSNIAVTLYNVSADHIATPRVITKQDQTIVWRWDTAEAFGGTAPDQNPSSLGTFTFNQRFPGQVFDSETGLFQNWNREYNARQGRYAQSDPIGLGGGINTYGYVSANPLGLADPSGLAPDVRVCVNGVCTPPPPVWDPNKPRPAPTASPAWTKPSPYLPTWNWSGITWPEWCDPNAYAKPPDNAYDPDPNGPKAPGKPGPETGFKDPKNGDQWVRNPNGRGYGWLSGDGTVWVPTGPASGSTGDAHGGPHWDVQVPGRGGYNMYPGGRRRDR